jgi:Zn-dependent peptidase ImmA (M78 family)/transcriptional regulator with XRE-family HTH domain
MTRSNRREPGVVSVEALGERIRTLREKRGMTQQDLARQAEFTVHQIVSQIELGQREVKAAELFRIARALRVDLGAFAEPLSSGQPAFLWRKKPEDGCAFHQGELVEWCRRYRSVVTAVGGSAGYELPRVSVDLSTLDYAVAEQAAHDFAQRLGSCPHPSSSLVEALERDYNVQVWFIDLGDNGGSACCSIGDYGAALFVNASEPPWRRNFDVAHELFHLLTWDSLGPDAIEADEAVRQRSERLADIFAAHLLLPADAVDVEIQRRRTDKGQISWADLIDVAREFDVSTEALLWRLKSLRRISEEQVLELKQDESFRRLDRAARRESWWRPSPLPDRFVRTAFMAHVKGYLSRTRLAEYLQTNLASLPGVLADYGLWGDDDYQKALSTS